MAADKYFIKLDQFEGPLDLLLHLIREHEIDIFNIDIFLLTTQYVAYLRLVRFNDLNTAGAFLAMAAQLIEIKSRLLLPSEKQQRTDEELDEEDPRTALQRRLLEFERYKRAAEGLSQMPQLGVEIQKGSEWKRLAEVYADVEGPLCGDPATLLILYEQLLKTIGERRPRKVEAKMHLISVEQTMRDIEDYLANAKFTLFQGMYNRFETRYELVAHILAVLELTKNGKLKIYQNEPMGPLWLYEPQAEEGQLPFARVNVSDHHQPELAKG